MLVHEKGGLSHAEIAEIFDISETALFNHLVACKHGCRLILMVYS
jgi:DNA-directed RNA polymerase specialized sigma24 family protein